MVVFRIGEEEFAIDILLAKEVVVMRDITPVPETDNYVEGVMNLRGKLIPVLDFRKRLRARQTGRAGERIIVVHLDQTSVGLMVDTASEVIRASEEMIEPPPDIISESEINYVAGIVNLRGRFITLIDVRRALSETITHDLEQVMRMISLKEFQPARAEAI
jgi:purine-binding chemotaxis protein CheW